MKQLFGKLIFNTFLCIAISCFMFSCTTAKINTYNPSKKIAPAQLQSDFKLLQNVLEQEHPSTYWYTPKIVLDKAFENAKLQLKDSLNEFQFRKIVSQVVALVKCGHTSVRPSKDFDKWIQKANITYFPFGIRTFKDTMMVSYNLYRKDTLLPNGTIIKSINGNSSAKIIDSIFQFISTDGDATNFKSMRISNNFPFYYVFVYGTSNRYSINYLDSLGKEKNIVLKPFFVPPPDTTKKIIPIKKIKPPTLKPLTKEQKRNRIRRMSIDSMHKTATMTISSFSGAKQKSFYRKSFKTLKKLGVKNLIIDVRNNGGGVIGNSVLLTKFIANKKFKVADSVFAIRKISLFNKDIKNRFWLGLTMLPTTRKKGDDYFHFRYFEKKQFRPKKNKHFNGNVYAITGGYSFSATTLFLKQIKDQPNVKLVGEETGGGAYGNSAVFIPNLHLPNSKLSIRIPVFRLVMDKNAPQTYHGIVPHYYVPPTAASLKNGTDLKMEKVLELIK